MKPGPANTSTPCPGLARVITDAGLTTTAAAHLCSWKRTRLATWISQGHAPRADLERLCRALDKHRRQPTGTTLEQVSATGLDPLDEAQQRLGRVDAELEAVRARLAAVGGELAAARAALAEARKL